MDDRIFSITVQFPRMLLAELYTHRTLDIKITVPCFNLVFDEPFIPKFGINRPGMSTTEELSNDALEYVSERWIDVYDELSEHKTNLDILLTPFITDVVIITGTEKAFNDFFELRCGEPYKTMGAQIDFMLIANRMRDSLEQAKNV